MPQRTKLQKVRASEKKNKQLTAHHNNPTADEAGSFSYFSRDLRRSLTIILAIIALEIVLYYGTMNNHLSFILKLGK